MEDLELFIFIVCIILSIIFWIKFYNDGFLKPFFKSDLRIRRLVRTIPLFSLLFLYIILKSFSSFDVKNDSFYMTYYLIFGSAWVGVMVYFLYLFGLSFRDDVVERNNKSAAYSISGAIIGFTFCFAGGNIGDGPGWWVVLFCALLSSAAIFLLWSIINLISDVNEVITVEHDTSAGMRFGAFFIAAGLVLGRAVAGDWVSQDATLRDFINLSWPVLILTLIASIINRLAKPKPETLAPSVPAWGVFPSAVYILWSVYYVISLGWWK